MREVGSSASGQAGYQPVDRPHEGVDSEEDPPPPVPWGQVASAKWGKAGRRLTPAARCMPLIWRPADTP